MVVVAAAAEGHLSQAEPITNTSLAMVQGEGPSLMAAEGEAPVGATSYQVPKIVRKPKNNHSRIPR